MGGRRILGDTERDLILPARGVYFFFEPGEARSDSGEGDRIVRVGMHSALAPDKSGLSARLSQLHGGASGRGTHRGSIFRLMVGEALLERSERVLPSWGKGISPRAAARQLGETPDWIHAQEEAVEAEVSQYIGNMSVVWVDTTQACSPSRLRSYFERNCIALLSQDIEGCRDAPSPAWLGRFSRRDRVRSSGLWNNNFVGKPYDPEFLNALAAF
jgi:hypothetical protein